MMRVWWVLVAAACGSGAGGVVADSGPGAEAADASVPDGPPAPAHKRIFITSQRYPADLRSAGIGADGVDGADRLCQLSADAMGLGGTFKAWISSTTVNALEHVTGDGPWYGMDGTLLFRNHANLATAPLAGISFDETGAQPDPFYEVWTGTAVGGGVAPPGGLQSTTCWDWTSTEDSETVKGLLGWEQQANSQWTDYNFGYCSPFSRHLYCFEE